MWRETSQLGFKEKERRQNEKAGADGEWAVRSGIGAKPLGCARNCAGCQTINNPEVSVKRGRQTWQQIKYRGCQVEAKRYGDPEAKGLGRPCCPCCEAERLHYPWGQTGRNHGAAKIILVNKTSFFLKSVNWSFWHTSCVHASAGGDSLHRKQQRWKLRPSHCTSSAWYTVLPQAPHLLPPPQTGILQEDRIVRTGPYCTRRLTRPLEGFLHQGTADSVGFFITCPDHICKRPAFLQSNLVSPPKSQPSLGNGLVVHRFFFSYRTKDLRLVPQCRSPGTKQTAASTPGSWESSVGSGKANAAHARPPVEMNWFKAQLKNLHLGGGFYMFHSL